MEERGVNLHERLRQQLNALQQEWAAMKTSKSSSAVSSITVKKALGFVDNSPRKLMLSLQASPEAEVIFSVSSPLRSPFKRKLFDESDDEDERKALPASHLSCWSSNVMRVKDDKKMKKKRGSVTMVVVLLLLVLVVLINGFDHFSIDREQIHTLVPT